MTLSAIFVLGAVSLVLASLSGKLVVMLMLAIFLAGSAWIAGQGLVVVLLAGSYPAEIRATAIGWTLAVGWIGSIISPMVASIPMSTGWSIEAILMIPVIPALLGAIAIIAFEPACGRDSLSLNHLAPYQIEETSWRAPRKPVERSRKSSSKCCAHAI